jgi:hypothetical protein
MNSVNQERIISPLKITCWEKNRAQEQLSRMTHINQSYHDDHPDFNKKALLTDGLTDGHW